PYNPALHSFPTRRSSDLGWSLIITTVILGISIAQFWGHMARTKRRIRAQIGEPPTLFLALGLAALVIAAPHGAWGFVLFALATRSEEHTSELQSRFDLVC